MSPIGRRALIVATGNYEDPKLRRLRAPAADAEQLAAVLRDPAIGNFDVDIAQDCDERTLRRRIARFFRGSARDDVLLVHVSGHGIKDARGALFLAASDTEIDLLDATAISAVWLDEQMTQSPSRRKLMLLDCCFSGKFPFNSTARAGDSVEVEERFHGRGRALITASNSMEYSYEGDQLSGKGEPSYFTAAIVDALKTGEADRDQDQWISVDELYEYVFERVQDASPNQTPSKQSALEGPLYVAHSTYKRPVEPARLERHLLDLLEHPVSGARLGAVEELAHLLNASNPSVALAARQALEKMRDDDSRKVANRASAVLAEAAVDADRQVESVPPTLGVSDDANEGDAKQTVAGASGSPPPVSPIPGEETGDDVAEREAARRARELPRTRPHQPAETKLASPPTPTPRPKGAFPRALMPIRRAAVFAYHHPLVSVTMPLIVVFGIGVLTNSSSIALEAAFYVLFIANVVIVIAKIIQAV